MTVEWIGAPRDRHSIAYFERKIIDSLKKPFDWLMAKLMIQQAI